MGSRTRREGGTPVYSRPLRADRSSVFHVNDTRQSSRPPRSTFTQRSCLTRQNRGLCRSAVCARAGTSSSTVPASSSAPYCADEKRSSGPGGPPRRAAGGDADARERNGETGVRGSDADGDGEPAVPPPSPARTVAPGGNGVRAMGEVPLAVMRACPSGLADLARPRGLADRARTTRLAACRAAPTSEPCALPARFALKASCSQRFAPAIARGGLLALAGGSGDRTGAIRSTPPTVTI